MKRLCFALDLVNEPEKIEEYKRHHREYWPGLEKNALNAGINALELYNIGDRLFMIWEVDDDFEMGKKKASDPELEKLGQKWEDLMSTFQKPLPQAKPGEKWVQMEKIFDLKDFI